VKTLSIIPWRGARVVVWARRSVTVISECQEVCRDGNCYLLVGVVRVSRPVHDIVMVKRLEKHPDILAVEDVTSGDLRVRVKIDPVGTEPLRRVADVVAGALCVSNYERGELVGITP